MDDDTDETIPKRWKLLPHSRTHRVLVFVVLVIAVAVMIRIAS